MVDHGEVLPRDPLAAFNEAFGQLIPEGRPLQLSDLRTPEGAAGLLFECLGKTTTLDARERRGVVDALMRKHYVASANEAPLVLEVSSTAGQVEFGAFLADAASNPEISCLTAAQQAEVAETAISIATASGLLIPLGHTKQPSSQFENVRFRRTVEVHFPHCLTPNKSLICVYGKSY